MSLPKIYKGYANSAASLLVRVRTSRMARQAILLLGINILAKGLTFFGTAYAAKCLGPRNLGVSAIILSLGQLIVVIAGGGLETVAVRRIAANPAGSLGITLQIVAYRAKILMVLLPVALLIAIWLAPREHTFAWCCGSIIAISSTFNLMFLFQGLEKLPLYGTISLFVSTFSALAFFSFKPGMVMGADLVVLAISGLLSVIINTLIIKRISGAGFGRVTDVDIKSLLLESRPYWTLGLVVFCYSNLQVPLVGYMADEESVGVYRSAVMLAAGLDLLYSSVNSLLLPRLVAWKEFGAAYLWRRQIELAKISFVVGCAVSFLMILTAPLVYRYILGVEFNGAVFPFQILVVGRMVVFVGQVFAWSLSALELDLAFLKASLAGAGFSLVANAMLVPSYGIVAAALVSVFAEILVHGICYYFVRIYTFKKII